MMRLYYTRWICSNVTHVEGPPRALQKRGTLMTQLAEGFKIIDADTHYTEPYDLWSSRAPKGYENRVLHVEEREGGPTWVVDGKVLGFARGGGVVARDST